MTFNDLDLIEPIKMALKDEGYTTPTPIQSEAIPILLDGEDLLGCAQTGTGKTAAFSIPIIQKIYLQRESSKSYSGIKALIITPTRELALQIDASFEAYGKYANLRHTVIYGGVGQKPQTDAISAGVDVLVATPGRLLDLIDQGFIKLRDLEFFVLDEADQMLDMGFIHDIRRIITLLPSRRQSLFFSATMPREIEVLANNILSSPIKVEVTPQSSTVEKIDQYLYYVDNKIELLIDLLQDEKMKSVLVFTRTKHGADKVVKLLSRKDITAEAIHGNKGQTTRQNTLANFKSGATRVLIATDIAARGIDVEELTHVVNYDLPNVPETYVHRIGRTGRAGREGVAYSFCNAEEVPLLKDIEKLIGINIEIAGGNVYETAEVRAAVADKKAALKEQTRQRNMYGSRRDGNHWRNKKRAENANNNKPSKDASNKSSEPNSNKDSQRRKPTSGKPRNSQSGRSEFSRSGSSSSSRSFKGNSSRNSRTSNRRGR